MIERLMKWKIEYDEMEDRSDGMEWMIE